MKKHCIIPFFIPHKGCPFACIFCRQDKITGRHAVSPFDIAPTIKRYLKTIPRKSCIEVAFFGGSFTGLDKDMQRDYLEKVQPFLRNGRIKGIRLSTRPDFIDQHILNMLKKYGVRRIELGIQSASDKVLETIKRGHSLNDIRRASKLILKNRIALGHQMMVGLPKSTFKDELKTAKESVRMRVSEVRIYPLVVIKDTELARMWRKKRYRPLSEEEAIRRCAKLISIFEKANVRVIRCGLHPSEGLLSGKEMLAGPFHQAFRQKVETYIYTRIFMDFFSKSENLLPVRSIDYNPADAAYIIGYKRKNASYVENAIRQSNIFRESKKIRVKTIKISFKDNKRVLLKRI
ncbi:MAG: radical SAM protein [Candidatus Omnitrophica bacterium]|nr:radical SAM protein [Candidatus Omnitrophota bacterium]